MAPRKTEAQKAATRRARNERYYTNRKASSIPPQPIAKKAPNKTFKISPEAVALSRAKPARASASVDELFRPSLPAYPPGVVPKGAKANLAMDDAFSSLGAWATTGYGQNDVGGLLQVFLGYPYLANQALRPEIRKIVEIVATESTRRWIKVASVGEDQGREDKSEKVKRLTEALDNFNVRDVVRKAIEVDGYFGRSHVLIDLGQNDSDTEVQTSIGNGRDETSKGKIAQGSLKGFRVIEPMWVYPQDYNSNDPASADFYKPQVWYVQGKAFHRTRILTMVGREVPDIFKPAYQFGGLSITQIALPYVDNFVRTRQSVSDLVHSFSVSGIKMDMASLLAGGGGADLANRAAIFNNYRDNKGLMLLNQETEEFFNVSTPLGTLDHLLAQSQEQISSIASIPLVKYLGITPSGLNACLPGDTLIFTDRGQVPIRDVSCSDHVMTRDGWAPLTFAGVTKHANELIEIRTENTVLRCTANHPIWSPSTNEFVPAENVRRGDCLLSIGERKDIPKTRRQWHGAGNGGGATESDTTQLSTLSLSGRFSSIGRCGKFIAGLSRLGSKSTILIAIKKTTRSLILRRCTETIIRRFTILNAPFARDVLPALSPCLAHNAERRSSLQSFQAGRNFAQPNVSSPIGGQTEYPSLAPRPSAFALRVKRRSTLLGEMLSIALENVQARAKIAQNTCMGIFSNTLRSLSGISETLGAPLLAPSHESASGAELNLSHRGGATKYTAPSHAKIAQERDDTERVISVRTIQANEPVYDLTVARGHLPEFFANGILTHNSSDGEVRCFYDNIHAGQENQIAPLLDTMFDIVQLHEFGEVDPEITYAFEPLWTLDEKEAAEVRQIEATTDISLCDAGILLAKESRQRIADDPDAPYSGLVVDDIPDEPTAAEALQPGQEPSQPGQEAQGGPPGQPQAQPEEQEPKYKLNGVHSITPNA